MARSHAVPPMIRDRTAKSSKWSRKALSRLTTAPAPRPDGLQVRARQTRDDIFIGLGLGTLKRPNGSPEVAFFAWEHQRHKMFVMPKKTEDRFSPKTVCQDYATSGLLFQRESQSATSAG